MINPLNRREFAIRASAGIAGLMTGSLLGGGLTYGQDPASQRLVLLGLNALARTTK